MNNHLNTNIDASNHIRENHNTHNPHNRGNTPHRDNRNNQNNRPNQQNRNNDIDSILKNFKDKKLAEIKEEEFYTPEGFVNKLASEFKEKVKTNQIRNIYNLFLEAKLNIKEREHKILQIYPQIVYAKGRNLITKEFYEFVRELLDKIRNEPKEFEKGFNIYQTLIAYLKYYSK